MQLPQADAESAAHSERVAAHIRGAIKAAGGAISFAEYMHLALYAPGLGYYVSGSRKFGAHGDFVTAPEVSSLYGRVVARQCAAVLGQLGPASIVEFGAGSGKLAADILEALAEADALPAAGYRILEVSPELCQRQRGWLQQSVPDLVGCVSWLDAMPHDVTGVIIANEVLDALPVERFIRRDAGVMQVCVSANDDGFALCERPAPAVLANAVTSIEAEIGTPLPAGYASDICLAAPRWIADVAASLEQGALLLFDYGLGRREYYAPERSGGWLRCHFRHHAHDDPLILPGIQDLTAWVDFSAVAGAAVDAGLEVLGFVSQAQFMIGGGLAEAMAGIADLPSDAQLKLSAEAKLLTLPTEMGEHFKCLGLARGDIVAPPAFSHHDRTATLG